MTDRVARLRFDVDTAALRGGTQAAEQFATGMRRTGQAADALQREMGEATQATRAMGQEARTSGRMVDSATAAMQRYQGAAQQAQFAMWRAQQGFGGIATTLSGRGGLQGALAAATTQTAGLAAVLGGGALAGAVTGVAALAAAFGVVVQQTAAAQDEVALLEARIANTLKVSSGQARATIEDLRGLANAAGVATSATAQTFLRLARNNETIGLTRREMVGLVDTFQKIGIVSGASSQEIQGALLQLSQALSAGRLNGDELRSIMEQMPELITALAKGLGVTAGEIKRMGAEGELTTQRIVDAIQKVGPAYEEQFARMPMTSARAFAQVGNEWEALLADIGRALDSSGMVQDLAGGMRDALSSMRDMVDQAGALAQVMPEQGSVLDLAWKYAANPMGAVAGVASAAGRTVAGAFAEPPASRANARLGEIAPILADLDSLIAQLESMPSSWREANRATDPAMPVYRDGQQVGTRRIPGVNFSPGMTAEQLLQEAASARERLERERAELNAVDGAVQPDDLVRRDATAAAMEAQEQRRMRAIGALNSASAIVRANDGIRSQRMQLELDLKTLERARMAAAQAPNLVDESLAPIVAGLDNSIAVIQRRIEQLRTARESYEQETERFRDPSLAGGGMAVRNEASGLRDQMLGQGQFLTEEAAIEIVRTRRIAQLGREAGEMARTAEQQRALAAATLEGGAALRIAEEAQRVANERFQRFGTTDAPAVTAAMAAYAETVAEAALATRALQDAQAQAGHDRQMRQIEDVTDAILRQAGAYAERAAAAQAEANALMRDGRPGDASRALEAFRAREEQSAARTLADMERRRREAERAAMGGDPITRRNREREAQIEEARRGARPEDRAGVEFALRGVFAGEDAATRRGTRDEVGERVRAMENELRLGAVIGRERRVLLRTEELIAEARRKGLEMSRQEAADLARTEVQAQTDLDRHREQIQRMEEIAKAPGRALGEALRVGFRKAFDEGEINGKHFMRALADGMVNMAERIMEAAIFAPLERMLTEMMESTMNRDGGGGWSDILAAFAQALGADLAGGGRSSVRGGTKLPGRNPGNPTGKPVRVKAHGGLIDRPTYMAAADGMVLAGEAGPEAIFPLRRGADGRLGLAAGGGGGAVVNVYDMRSGESAPVEVKQRERADGRREIEIMLNDHVQGMVRGGKLNAPMRDQFQVGQPVKRV